MPISFKTPVYSDRIKQTTQTVFKGYNHTYGAGDGEIYDMTNMCGDEYPVARPRRKRSLVRSLAAPNGLTAHDGLYWVDGTGFYAAGEDGTGELKGNLSNSKKTFAHLGAYVIILPDKKYFNRLTGEFGSLEASWSGTASFADGTFAGIEADGCRIITTGTPFPFKVGDAVTISGASNGDNNKTIIIREITADRKNLGFYENSFSIASSQTLTISRNVPDLDFICENENRLWGCKEDTIYASKPGDPFNWNVFDGLKSDSYAVTVGSSGDFTGCISYLGYPVFFKEDRVYKVYGSKASDYQVMSSASIGVLAGSADSLAIAGETLHYLSPVGMMLYTGGVPENISRPLGEQHFVKGVAGSDGVRYYISLTNADNQTSLFCYDTRSGMWYREDDFKAIRYCREGGIYALAENGGIWQFGDERADTEEVLTSMLEFADFTENSPNKKHTSKVQLRVELEPLAELNVLMSFDDGDYIPVGELKTSLKRSYYLPIMIRRCDHFRIKLVGTGLWRLYSITREYAEGSQI